MAPKGRPISRPTNDFDTAASLYELANKVGCSYRTVNRLRRQGLEPESSGRFSVARALWFLRNIRERASHPESAAALAWRERRIKAQALALEHELAARTRELVSISDARLAWNFQTTKVGTAFSRLGADLAPLLIGCGPQECEAIVTQRVLRILRALSEDGSISPVSGKDT